MTRSILIFANQLVIPSAYRVRAVTPYCDHSTTRLQCWITVLRLTQLEISEHPFEDYGDNEYPVELDSTFWETQ